MQLPRTEDMSEINRLKDQIEALKHWIKYWSDVDIDMDNLMEWEKEQKEESEAMTDLEIERYVKRIEMYSGVFNYGRPEEKKMAEGL